MSVDRISDEAEVAAIDAYLKICPSGVNTTAMLEAIAAALPLLEGGKGEAVAWMIRNKGDGELHWNEELCVFADAASADEMAECLNDGDPPIWEALPLYTAPQPAAQQPAVPALEVFRIAGGDVECCPEPTADEALKCLRDLRKCYDEALQHVPLQQPAGDGGVGALESAIQQAQQWKMEAQTANATIAEIYRLVDSKAGNWNGAEPVRQAIAALRANAESKP